MQIKQEDLPHNLTAVFQLQDSDTYNVCGLFNSMAGCDKYCPGSCILESTNGSVDYNASIHMVSEAGQKVDADYVNRTLYFSASAFCSSKAPKAKMSSFRAAVIGIAVSIVGIYIILQTALCVRYCRNRKRVGKQWEEISRLERGESVVVAQPVQVPLQ